MNWSSTPQPTLLIEGVQLTSGIDQEAEARVQASRLPDDARQVFCYGHGLGHLPRLLAEQGRKVVVVSMNREITAAVPKDGWADKVKLVHGASLTKLYGPYAYAPMEVMNADLDCVHLRDRIVTGINREANMRRLESLRPTDEATLEINRQVYDHEPDARRLFGSRTGSWAIVVGAGPTLAEQYDWVRSQPSRLVIACSTALRPLIKHRISPDIVVVIEQDPLALHHLDGLDMSITRSIVLVYHPVVPPAFVNAWRGPRYVCSTVPENLLFTDGTVLHDATDLAVRMGARTVTLVGFDCCHLNDHSHADDVRGSVYPVTSMGKPTMVLNGYGDAAESLPSYCHLRVAMEEYIATHPEVAFYKRGRAGVPLMGATWDD